MDESFFHLQPIFLQMIGPTVNRAQPQRYTAQYHSVQAAPMLVNPSPQVIFHGGPQNSLLLKARF